MSDAPLNPFREPSPEAVEALEELMRYMGRNGVKAAALRLEEMRNQPASEEAKNFRLYGVKMNGDGSNGDSGSVLHIPGSALSGQHTLCGYTDLHNVTVLRLGSPKEISCDGCLDVVKAALQYQSCLKEGGK